LLYHSKLKHPSEAQNLIVHLSHSTPLAVLKVNIQPILSIVMLVSTFQNSPCRLFYN
jgi:hypothetical protein